MRLLLLLLSLAGLGASCYLLWAKDTGNACHFVERVSCDAVLNSRYATLARVPLTVLGVVYFATQLLFLASPAPRAAVFFLSLAGAAFVLYFVACEALLGALCPVCTLVHLVILASLWLTWRREWLSPRLAWQYLVYLRYFVLLALLVAALPALHYNLNAPRRPDPEAVMGLARCMRSRGARMYGRRACKFCRFSKALFGPAAFALIDYVECDGEVGCEDPSVTVLPTWEKEGGERLNGFRRYEELAEFFSCPEPSI